MEHDVNVSHVCQECESVHNQTARSKSLTHMLLSSLAFLIFALLLLYVSAFCWRCRRVACGSVLLEQK